MASLQQQFAEPVTRPDYETWMQDVRSRLAAMDFDVDTWQKNWAYDFRYAYDAGKPAWDAAESALDFWWRELMAASWT